MTILLMLIPLGLVILAVAIAFFIWAVRNGQFEDLEGEGERIFFDDEPLPAVPRRGEGRSRKSGESGISRGASEASGGRDEPGGSSDAGGLSRQDVRRDATQARS